MIIAVVLIVLIAIGVYIAYKLYGYETWGVILQFVAGIYFLIHIIFIIMAPIEYRTISAKREAFVETLEAARQSARELEAAAILKEIVEWNSQLAMRKVVNSYWLLDDYVDDRLLLLKPIK